MLNQTLDTRELMTGKDGCLFVEVGNKNIPLLEVENFSVVMNVNSVEKQYVGNPLVNRVPSGVSVDLTFTESVVRDDVFLEPILEALSQGYFPTYNFQGKIEKPDGQEQRVALNNAVPNGSIGIQNVTPGEVISREMSFALNTLPKFIKSLVASYLNQ